MGDTHTRELKMDLEWKKMVTRLNLTMPTRRETNVKESPPTRMPTHDRACARPTQRQILFTFNPHLY